MTPKQLGAAYDRLAAWWHTATQDSNAGLAYLRRAIGLCARRRRALDVGCGDGRLIGPLAAAGFRVTGIDVSAALLDLAQARQPAARFVRADVCVWQPPARYDLIVAWDSTFHVPHRRQRQVHRKLCTALAPGGVILFTAGGTDGERYGTMQGERIYHSSLDHHVYLRLIEDAGCRCLLFDRDQFPEDHCVIIGRKA